MCWAETRTERAFAVERRAERVLANIASVAIWAPSLFCNVRAVDLHFDRVVELLSCHLRCVYSLRRELRVQPL